VVPEGFIMTCGMYWGIRYQGITVVNIISFCKSLNPSVAREQKCERLSELMDVVNSSSFLFRKSLLAHRRRA